jgi:hypothetical protein
LDGLTDGRTEKGIEAFRHFAKERREYLLVFHSPSSVLVCFSFYLLFCFYDTSIGRQITSKKEEESNTTSSILLNHFISNRFVVVLLFVFKLTTVLDHFGRPTDPSTTCVVFPIFGTHTLGATTAPATTDSAYTWNDVTDNCITEPLYSHGSQYSSVESEPTAIIT